MDRKWLGTHDAEKKKRSTSGLPLKGILDPNEAGMGQKNISGKKKIRKKAAVSA
jgi:hypothetical protein